MSLGGIALTALASATPVGPGGPASTGGEPGDVHFVDASVELGTDAILGAHMLDLHEDGTHELVLVTRSRELEQRELRLHRFENGLLVARPFQTVPVLEDVVAFGFGDVRADPGQELLFLTRSGAWSYSLARDGYRDNIERFVEQDLLYDVPDAHALPRWRYVIPREGGDWVILPGVDHAALWRPERDETGATTYGRAARFDTDEDGATFRGLTHSRSLSFGGGGARIRLDDEGANDVLFPEADEPGRIYLSDSRSYRAPALADADGDGQLDLIEWTGEELRLHIARANGFAAEPDRVEPVPAYLAERVDDIQNLLLRDIDRDGDMDLLVHVQSDPDDLENTEISLYVLRNDGRRMLPEQPDQLLRFEAVGIAFQVADVDGDGRDDLVVREYELPGLWETMTGLDFELTHLLFLGEDGRRPFARKPALRAVESFDESTIEAGLANRHLTHDFDGDGIADLVEIDLRGRIGIRRLRLDSGFFGGESWELDEGPWKRFETRGNVDDLVIDDWNGDGLGDILSRSKQRVTLIVSRKGAEAGR